MGESIEEKLSRIGRVTSWILVFIIIILISVPGIVVSIQYSKDACVTNSKLNIELDEWLLIASFAYIVIILTFLPWACCRLRKIWFRLLFVFLSLLVTVWGIIGVYLLVNSNLKCGHDSLWVVSLVNLTSVGLFILCLTMYCINIYIRYRQKRIVPQEVWEESEKYGWLDDYNFSDGDENDVV
jgi:hypothetical protein